METPLHDLERWIPRLVSTWRGSRRASRRGGGSPAGQLVRDELQEVAAAVARLSHGLTRDRELAGARYLDDERLLGAYLLFYWPTSYLQARGTISELPAQPRSVLDLGSGPAPMAFAALDTGAREVLACDRSAAALAAARTLAHAARLPLDTQPWNPARGRPLAELAPGRRFDLVLAGHLLNELFRGEGAALRRAALLEEAAGLLAPGGSLVVIEPALRETSRALLEVRDLLVARGYGVRAPCLFRGPCPALLRDSDWCHAERPVAPPPLVADLARAAGLHRDAVKMSYLVLAPRGEAPSAPLPSLPPEGGGRGEPAGARVFRIVSEPLPSKGRLRYMACGPEGRMGLALQEKHVSEANRRFERLLRGDVISVTGAEPRGDGLRLSEESRVTVIAAAGEPVPRGS